jgi:Putative glucose uptake permease
LSPQNRRKVWHTATAKNIITGLVWGIGNFFMFMAIPKVGLAISYSLAQCGIVISTFGSIWLLGEKRLAAKWSTRRLAHYWSSLVGSLSV